MRVLVLVLVVAAAVSVSGRAQDYEDNDFAEFEVFEEEEEVMEDDDDQGSEDPSPRGGGVAGGGGGGGGGGGVGAGVRSSMEGQAGAAEAEVEEDEEAVVEDEDENDEFSHFHDEEEFIGFDSERPQGARMPKTQEEPKITIANVPLHLRSNWDSFYLEMLMIAGLVVYFINFIVGKSKNQKLANAWFTSHKNLLEQNFALVGDDGKQVPESGGLQKESENVYTLWCSGRTNMEGMLVELKFIKRQDMIGVVSQLIRPSSDQLLVKVHLDEMDSFVFALATKKTAARLSKEMTDISTFCPEKKSADKFGFGSQYVLMNELGEVASTVLGDPKVTAVLNKFSGMVDFLHFSDQYSGPKQPEDTQPTKLPEVRRALVFGFNFPGRGNPSLEAIESMRPLLQLVFHVTDKLRRFKLSKEGKAKAEKNRSRVEEAFLKATHAARAEMAQAKREERKRMEREKMLEIDDPDKQRKWEEREQRRQMKRRAPKMKQLKA
ncbi:PAT complex subunit CCDC47-like isoform X2 [Scylla paramamosain]|uniref:PAT complex subunit CCDC47-like isoform X2 n=1 Tax=Scylla paramamosain TaxID=85552 RepID=UPI003083C4B9